MRLSANTGICEYLRVGEYEAEREHRYLRVSDPGGYMRHDLRRGEYSLSANTGICDDLRGGEYEPEREHWFLRRSDRRGI